MEKNEADQEDACDDCELVVAYGHLLQIERIGYLLKNKTAIARLHRLLTGKAQALECTMM